MTDSVHALSVLTRDEFGHPLPIGEVHLEEVEERLGWAVFTGCDGDSINFHAFFRRREAAARYLERCQDHDSDDYLCDPAIVPAAIIDGRIVASNHYDDELSAAVLARAIGAHGLDIERFREEAALRVGLGEVSK